MNTPLTNVPDREKYLQDALREIWGYQSFRPHQRETIEALIEGRDSLTVLPTGGGKSLCYQLPAALMQGTAVIVSPLISLMEDQVNALTLLGVNAAYINSSQSADEVRKAKSDMFRGKLKLLYVSPERLMLDHFNEELREIDISFFAIDEAHCISQWGHDFRPEYKQLSQLRSQFPNASVHAFTATAPPKLQKEIVHELRLRAPLIEVGSYYRKNLYYQVRRRNSVKKQLTSILSNFDRDEMGIVYCLTRKETERIAEFLKKEGYQALPYHAGMSSQIRQDHQNRFQSEQVKIIVATVAFGMGIDQSNVRFVIHVGMPRTLSHYQQEAGRAGRDGLPSRCVLIYGANDIQFWRRIIEEEASLAPQRMAQLQDMINYAAQIKCRHKTLVEYFGQPFPDRCDGCDVCNGEIESMPQSRQYARMIISTVLKVRENFGGAYIAQVLTGSKDRKVLMNGHDSISVYNLLGHFKQNQVHDWVNQLESQGYLQRSDGQYPVYSVSSMGYWLLRPDKYGKSEGELPVHLVETRTKEKARVKSNATVGNYDSSLFSRLRQMRMELASRLGVPAFVVFGDKSLQDMAARKPTTDAEFLEVFGVGKHKLTKFGEPMMRIIRDYVRQQKS